MISAKPDPSKILDEAMQLEPTTRVFIAWKPEPRPRFPSLAGMAGWDPVPLHRDRYRR